MASCKNRTVINIPKSSPAILVNLLITAHALNTARSTSIRAVQIQTLRKKDRPGTTMQKRKPKPKSKSKSMAFCNHIKEVSIIYLIHASYIYIYIYTIQPKPRKDENRDLPVLWQKSIGKST